MRCTMGIAGHYRGAHYPLYWGPKYPLGEAHRREGAVTDYEITSTLY